MTKSQVNSPSKPKTTIIAVLFSALMLVTGLIGCSSSSDPVIPAEDANGLFTGTGTVNSGTALTDVRGFVHEGRFIFFDETEAVLYDGQISAISGSDLTATVDVYEDGAVTTTGVGVTGTVTGRSSMLLSLNGTGYAAGSLTLTFDLLYDRGATIAKLFADSFARWVGDAHTPTTINGGNIRFLSENDVTVTEFRGDSGAPSNCFYDGFKSIPDPAINIYLITVLDVTDVGINTCDHVGSGYTGFFAIVDGIGTDDTLLFAATNGTNSNFSVMTK